MDEGEAGNQIWGDRETSPAARSKTASSTNLSTSREEDEGFPDDQPFTASHDLCLAFASPGHLNQQNPRGRRLAGGATETINGIHGCKRTLKQPPRDKSMKTSKDLPGARYSRPHSRTARCLPPAAAPQGARSPSLRAASSQPPQRGPLSPAGGLPQPCCVSGSSPSLNSPS